MRKFLLIALCLLSMNVLAVTEKVTVWKASAFGSSGSELVKGLKNADGSDGSDAFQGSDGNFYFNTGVASSWSWDRYMTIAPAAFANIDMKEGDLLNVMLNYTDGKSLIALKQADASKFDGYNAIAPSSSVSSGSYSLKLTSSIISQIKDKGLAIGGINLNWNEVSISPKGYTPPITKLDKPGFHTDGVRLLDANGKEFLMRGYNYSYAWQKDWWGAAFSTAKKYKCNALRIQLSDGQKDLGGYCDADQVSKLISSCKDNRFIGVFNVQDTGGGNDANVLLHAADYWVGIKNAVIGQEKYCIVNIGNEWMGSPGRDCNGEWGDYQENLWSDTYIEAVRRIRSAGIKNTLMIDCNGYGQYADIIWKEGQRILDEDKKYFEDGKPNIIFSIHFYEKACYWDYEKGVGSRVAHSIDKALSIGAPVCIGEYAYSRKSEEWKMDWETIQDYSKTMNIGYLGWSFTGNGDPESQGLDMFNSDGSQMYKNGKCIILHPNDGIQATSVICSVYDGGAESLITERYVSGGEASADVQSYLKDANGQALDYVKLKIPEASLKLNQGSGLTLKGDDLKRAGALEGRFFRIFLKPGTTITSGKEDKLYGAAFAATANITYGNLKTGDRSLSEWKYIDLPCDRNSADLTIKGKYCTIEGIYLMKPEYLYKEGQAETELKDSYNGKVDYSSISVSGSMSIALGDEASKFSDYKTYKGTATGMLASLKANGLRINGHDWTLIGIALYGPKTTAASNGLTGCIDFKRYLSASQWRAMSLPYNLDEEQTAKLFGNDAKITTLTSVVRDDQKKTLSISFGPVNSIEANKPYLVKVPADRHEFVLEGVSLDVDKFTSTSVNINGVSFVSTAPAEDGTDRTELPMNAYYLSNNVFYPHKNNKVTIKAGLCYMVLGAEAAAKGYSLNFQNEDGSVTGIQEIPAARENKAMEIYTLQGVRVLRPGKGIYIVNGKKMVF